MSALALLCMAFALTGLMAVLHGGKALLAEQRLDARMSARLGTPSREPRRTLRLPAIFSAKGRDRTEIEDKLRLAGFQGPYAVEHFVWIRLGATLGTAFCLLLLSHLLWGSLFARPILPLIGAGLAFIASKQVLQIFATARAHKITAEFPFLLDLMLMMLESGVSLDQCFRSIARDEIVAVPNHAVLIANLVADIDRGMTYETALDRWASRVAVKGARELAALFRQALFQGIELAPALREFIREFTQQRVARAREAMGKITVKMVVLMIVFFMPGLFIVLAGPPVVTIFDTLRGMNQ